MENYCGMRGIVLGLIVLVTISIESFGQTKVERIEELVSKFSEYGDFNGSVLVSEKGKVIYKSGFGLANMEWDIPNETDTKFRLASVSKQFTAMLIVQLAAEGKLNLHAPISTYLPDYPKQNADIITAHHLLTHSSGTPNYTSFSNYRKDMVRNSFRPVDLVQLFADSALLFTPGSKFDYSNSGYSLLGYLVEVITGKSYGEVLQEKIFLPLNMVNSGYAGDRSLLKNRASGYDKNGSSYINTNYINMSVAFGAGGIYSTVEDLYLWDQALYTEDLLPKKYMDLVFEKQMPTGGEHYGYGWDVGETTIGNTEDRVETVGHNGGINGFNTIITRIPADQSSIILLNNAGGAPLNTMTRAICGILSEQSYDMPKQSIATNLQKIIDKKGIEAGVSFYHLVKDSSNYYISEGQMNTIGYEFIWDDKLSEAIAVFKLNVDAFPEAFNTYDSYAEVLLTQGDSTLAIKNYQISVNLNPENKNGIEVLKKLEALTD
ncbi:MAG: CubicO group peptidase (beta-lactamase class C family) [Psychroserpens sp.]